MVREVRSGAGRGVDLAVGGVAQLAALGLAEDGGAQHPALLRGAVPHVLEEPGEVLVRPRRCEVGEEK